ncbi:hypothetical protein EPN83_02760 [Patescibacteria group bacterium]|nr:MAG: hypothetical protein EPN83_02760 [Patescibacteria group bacterium]
MDREQNQNPNMEGMGEPATGGQRPIGPAIGVVVILLVIVLGGLYFWGQRVERGKIQERASEQGAQTDIQALQTQGTSDDVTSIESDLTATSLEGVGSELNAIESEFQGLGQ